MMILTFLSLLLITNGSAVGEMENVTGIVGQDVLLSCRCSSDYSTLAWQKASRILRDYPPLSSTQIDQAYVGRTELFLEKDKSNCSIIIRNISSEDAGVYTCHAIKPFKDNIGWKESFQFNLTVSENEGSEPDKDRTTGEKSLDTVSISVPILVVLILGVAALLTLLIKRRHRTNTDNDSPAQQPMIQSV